MLFQLKSTSLVTESMVLEGCSEEQLFGIVFGFIPDTNRYYCSPVRQDRNPGCYFKNFKGKLYFIDFTENSPVKDCFSMIQQKFNLKTYDDAVAYAYELMVEGVLKKLKKDTKEGIPSRKRNDSMQCTIAFLPRDWNVLDKKYWQQYGISLQGLEQDGVFPVKRYLISYLVESTIVDLNELCYAYTRFRDNRIKLYFPLRKGRNRFLGNCKKNDIGCVGTDNGSDRVVITKSYKDAKVLCNLLNEQVLWVQNEGILPDIETILESTRNRRIHLLFDNDNAGKAASKRFFNYVKGCGIDIVQWDIPESTGCKDIADCFKRHRMEKTKTIIRMMERYGRKDQ